jgi:cytochrome b561
MKPEMTIPSRYTTFSIVLHWLVFFFIACGFELAVYMTGLPLSPLKLKFYSWHKWIGVTVFMLALMRLAWRLTHPAPPLPATTPAWQRTAATAVHCLLYALIIVIPVSGWLHSSATGLPTVYLTLWQLPDLLARDKALAETLKAVHVSLNYLLFVLVAVHAGAAIKHHFLDRDDVLQRMLPFAKLRRNR